MSPFKQVHGQLENLGFPHCKGKLLATFGAWAGGVYFLLVSFPGHFAFDDHPSSALGAGYARADDPVRHLTFSVNDFGWRKNPEGSASLSVLFSPGATAIEHAAECPATLRRPGPTV